MNIRLGNEILKSFAEIHKSHPTGHHLRIVCVVCGTSDTCRCMAKKTEIRGICDKCAANITTRSDQETIRGLGENE